MQKSFVNRVLGVSNGNTFPRYRLFCSIAPEVIRVLSNKKSSPIQILKYLSKYLVQINMFSGIF